MFALQQAVSVYAVGQLSPCQTVQASVPASQHILVNPKQCTADILIPHERAITLVFWHQQWLVGDAPFHLKCALKVTQLLQEMQISTYNISTVRDSEKNSIMTNKKSTTGFPTSYRLSVYVTPKSPKRWLKKRFIKNSISVELSLLQTVAWMANKYLGDNWANMGGLGHSSPWRNFEL